MKLVVFNPLRISKCSSIYFCLILIFCTPLFACKSNTESNTESKSPMNKSISMTDDKAKIKSIVDKLAIDYKSIMSMYEMDMEAFVTTNASSIYVNKYKSLLDQMSYMSEEFKTKLVSKITGMDVPTSESNVRPFLDPLFNAEYVADKIQIQGYDIEDDMASVGVYLYDTYDKITSCYTELFFDKNEKGEWTLTGHDSSESIRKNHKNMITPTKIVGLYNQQNKEGVNYSVVKKGDKFVLENCNPDCIDVGEIEYVELKEIGIYQIKLKNLEGELIPTFKIENTLMKVHEYNVLDDKWENNTYNFKPGVG